LQGDLRIHVRSARRSTLVSAVWAILASHSSAPAQGADAYVAKIPAANIPSSVVLSTSGGSSGPGQTVEIPFDLSTTGTAAASFQIDLSFDPTVLTFASARVGAQLTAVGKGLQSTVVSSGDVRLATTGMNQNTIASGVVAYAKFTLGPQFSGSTPVTLVNCMSAGALGSALSTGCAAGNITSAISCDVDGNGSVTVADVQAIVNQAVGAIPAVDDLDGNGAVNVVDVQRVINAVLGLGCVY